MKVCTQETESVMSALHSVAEAQLSPASRPQARPAPGRKCVSVCVCGMQQAERRKYLNMPKSNMLKHAAGRKKKALKHAEIKHAEARGKKKHAGWTTSLHANDQT